jgi:hypothetical protein
MSSVDPTVALLLVPIVFVIAGQVVALAFRPLTKGHASNGELLRTAFLGGGIGLGFLPALSFLFFYAVFQTYVMWQTVLASVVLGVGGALAWWRWGRRDNAGVKFIPSNIGSLWVRHRYGLGTVAVIYLFYILKFDHTLFSIGQGCFHSSGFAATGDLKGEMNLFVNSFFDARLGNTAVLSAYIALASSFGFRLLYGLCGGMLALGGYVLGTELTGQRRYGYLGLFLLALNPYVLKVPLLDENLLTLAFMLPVFPYLLRSRAPWVLVGLMVSLMLGMRHILGLVVPSLFFIIWATNRGRALIPMVTFGVAMFIGTIPYHVHHLLAQGSVFAFENFGPMPPFPHDFGFGVVQWRGLLNWPFHSMVVRTPQNAFPMFLQWPFWILDHFGIGLTALALLGIGASVKRNRMTGLFLIFFFVPVYFMLAVQENWDFVNKMNVLMILFVPPLIWTLEGVVTLVRRPLVTVPITVGLVIVGFVFVHVAGSFDAPADERYARSNPTSVLGGNEFYPVAEYEPAGFLELRRDTATDIALWPDYGRVGDFQDVFRRRRVLDVVHHLGNTQPKNTIPFGWSAGTIQKRSAAVVIELDLTKPFWAEEPIARIVDGPADIDLTSTEKEFHYAFFTSQREIQPMVLIATSGKGNVAGIMLQFGDFAGGFQEDYLSNLVNPDWSETSSQHRYHATPEQLQTPRNSIRIKVPSGSLSLFFRINQRSHRGFFRKAIVDRREISLSPARWIYHD